MHDSGVRRQFLPLALQLLRDVVVQTARKGQHKGHHMRADVVVVNFAEVGDRDRMSDQFRVVIAGRRRRLRCLQPTKVPGLAQQVGRDRTEGGVGMRQRLGRLFAILRDDDFEFGQSGGEPRAPLAGLFTLRRQHHELGRHWIVPPRLNFPDQQTP